MADRDRISVRVVGDATGLRSSVRDIIRDYNRNPANPNVKIKVEADGSAAGISALRASIKRAVKEASRGLDTKVKVGIEFDRRSIDRAVRDLSKRLKVKVDYDYGRGPKPPAGGGGPAGGGAGGGGGFGQSIREMSALSSSLGRAAKEAEKTAEAVRRQRSQLIQQTPEERRRSEEEQRRRERNSPFRRNNDSIFSTLGGAGAFNRYQGALIGLGVTTIAPLAGAFTALASAAAIATAGVGAFATAAVSHLAQVTVVMKGLSDGTLSLQTLPREFNEFVPALRAFQASWREMMNETRKPVFDVFITGMNIVRENLPQLSSVVNAVAGGFQQAFVLIGQAVRGPEIQGFIQIVKTEAPSAIASLTTSALNLGKGLLTIFTGFAPAGRDMLSMLQSMTEEFSKWATRTVNSNGFQQVLDYVRENGPLVLSLFQNILAIAGNLVQGLAPIGSQILGIVEGFTGLVSTISPGWWTAMTSAVLLFWAAQKAVGLQTAFMNSGIMRLTRAFTGYAQVMYYTRDAELAAATAARALGTSIKAALISTGIGAALVAASYLWEAFATGADKGTKATEALTASQNEFAAALQKSNGLLDEQAKLAAVNDLQNSGLYAAGRQAGITPEQLTKAYIGGPEAFQALLNEQQTRNEQLLANKKAADKAFAETSVGAAHEGSFGQGLIDDARARKEAADQAYQSSQNFINQGNVLLQQFQTGKISAEDFARGMNALGGAIDQTASLMQRLQAATAQPEYLQVIDLVKKKTQDYDSAVRTVSRNQREYRDAVQAVTDTIANNAEALDRAKDAVRDAKERYVDSLKAIKDAQDRVKESTEALADAREKARRQLRDARDEEESGEIRLIHAQQRVLQTSGLTADNVERREALLELKNAQEDLGDTRKDNAKLRKQGIEGNPAVVAAVKEHKNAQEALNDAHKNSKKALDDVSDAERNVGKVRRANDKALRNAKQARDDALQNLKDSKTAADKLYKALTPLDKTFTAKLKADKGDAEANIKTVMTYVRAAELQVEHPTWDSTKLWDQATKDVNKGWYDPSNNQTTGPDKPGGGYARGGPVRGRGTSRSDSIPAWLSNGEHVWTAAEVQAAGGHSAVEGMRRTIRGYAAGGPVINPTWNGPTLDIGKMKLADTLLKNLNLMGTGAPGTPVSGGGPGSIAEIIAAMATAPSNIKVDGASNRYTDNEGFMGRPHGGHTNHGRHLAVDFNYGGDTKMEHAIAMWWMGTYGTKLKELIHTDSGPPWVGQYIKNGKIVPPSYYASVLSEHKNHVHVAADPGFTQGATGIGGYTGGVGGLKDYFLGNTGGSATPKGAIQEWALSQLSHYGWSAGQFSPLKELWQHESGWNPHATGSLTNLGRAYGIPQSLPGSKMASAGKDWHDNYQTQIKWGLGYIKDRYGTPADAWGKWQARSPHWYKDGGAVLADGGAVLPPRSVTAVANGTNQWEHVGFPGGMSKAEKREFAAMVAQALQAQAVQVHMDGDVVARKAQKSIGDILGFQGGETW